MKKLRREKKGQSVLEYTMVLLIVLGAFFIFQKYIVRGFSGRWKGVGDSLGQGRLYDSQKTKRCALFRDEVTWYDEDCFEARCDCLSVLADTTTCEDCVAGCVDPMCD